MDYRVVQRFLVGVEEFNELVDAALVMESLLQLVLAFDGRCFLAAATAQETPAAENISNATAREKSTCETSAPRSFRNPHNTGIAGYGVLT